MANKHATGNDWGNINHWDPVNVPITDDDVFIPDTLGSSITGTMDQGGVDLDSLYTHGKFLYDVGASGAPLILAADLITLKSPGNFFFECSKHAGALKTDLVRIMCANRDAIVELGSETGDAGDFDNIIAMRGNILLKANILFGAAAVLKVHYIDNVLGDVRLRIASGADTLPGLEQRGGLVVSDRAMTLAHVHAGELIQGTQPITTCHIYGGRVVWNDETIGGDGVAITVWPGAVLDLMQNTVYKTISTVNRYPGSIVHTDSSLHAFTAENWL